MISFHSSLPTFTIPEQPVESGVQQVREVKYTVLCWLLLSVFVFFFPQVSRVVEAAAGQRHTLTTTELAQIPSLCSHTHTCAHSSLLQAAQPYMQVTCSQGLLTIWRVCFSFLILPICTIVRVPKMVGMKAETCLTGFCFRYKIHCMHCDVVFYLLCRDMVHLLFPVLVLTHLALFGLG